MVSPTLMSAVLLTKSSRIVASPSPMTTPCARDRSTSAPAAALRSISSCTLEALALGTMTRPTTPFGASTPMSGRMPAAVPLPIVMVRKSGVADPAMTSAAIVSRRVRVFRSSSRESASVRWARARSCCSSSLRRRQIASELGVLVAHAAQIDVAAPERRHAVDDARRRRAAPAPPARTSPPGARACRISR